MCKDLIRLSELQKFPIRMGHYDTVHGNEHYIFGVETVIEYAENLPKVDAEPVRHGRWIHDINNRYGCSECMARETMSHRNPKNYCPNCGAKMDLEENV